MESTFANPIFTTSTALKAAFIPRDRTTERIYKSKNHQIPLVATCLRPPRYKCTRCSTNLYVKKNKLL